MDKIYITLILAVAVEAKVDIYYTNTPVERIGGRLYRKELLTDAFDSPSELAYDSTARNLFFMYMDDVIKDSGRAYINIITKKAIKINGIEKNKAIAVDAEEGDVYFGSEDGLYKYDPIDNVAKNIGLYNVNIMKIVVRNNEMYVIDANNHRIYKVYDQGTRSVLVGDMQTVMNFEVDNAKNIHFVTLCGLYCLVNGGYVVKNSDLATAYHLIVGEDKVYGVTENGLFDINCFNGTAQKVADLNFVPKSITFGDYGDVFYSEGDNIYRLRPIRSYQIFVRKKTQLIQA